MFRKIVTTLLLAYFATPGDASLFDGVWDGLTATWPTGNVKGNYKLPMTLDDAIADDWTYIQGAEPSSTTIAGLSVENDSVLARTFEITDSLGYKGNPRLVLYYNSKGNVVGVQIGFPAEDVKNVPMDYENHVGISTKILNGVKYYVAEAYFFVDINGNHRLLFTDANGVKEFPCDAKRIEPETTLLKKNCVPTMGTHYYELSPESNCDNFYPWILLTNQGDVVGVALQIPGTTSVDESRTWNENIPGAGVQVAVSDAPTCMAENVNKYGIISVHVWFRSDATKLTCG